MDVLRVIKINVLALVAFPLLILATVTKLLAKAMEKILTIIGTVLVIGGIALVFELAKNPGDFFNGLLMFIVLMALGGLLTLIVILVLRWISAIVMGGISLIIGVINALDELVYAGYAALYHICYEDYCLLGLSRKARIASCFIYSLLRGVNRVIIFLATHAIKVFVTLSAVVVVGSLIKINAGIQATFGLNVFAYLKLFSAFEVVYGVVLYLAFLAGFIILLISLGIEWSEWGEEMSLSTSDYEKYIQSVRNDYTAMNQERLGITDEVSNKRMEKCKRYMDLLNVHIEAFGGFLKDIGPVVEKSEDYILRANRGQYITDLHEVTEELNKYVGGQVPFDEFEKLIPRIEQIDALKKKIEQQVQQIRESKEKKEAAGFFSGCDTVEKLEKRYKALCRTYHPDAESGDEETFKRMLAEYEDKKKQLATL